MRAFLWFLKIIFPLQDEKGMSTIVISCCSIETNWLRERMRKWEREKFCFLQSLQTIGKRQVCCSFSHWILLSYLKSQLANACQFLSTSSLIGSWCLLLILLLFTYHHYHHHHHHHHHHHYYCSCPGHFFFLFVMFLHLESGKLGVIWFLWFLLISSHLHCFDKALLSSIAPSHWKLLIIPTPDKKKKGTFPTPFVFALIFCSLFGMNAMIMFSLVLYKQNFICRTIFLRLVWLYNV